LFDLSLNAIFVKLSNPEIMRTVHNSIFIILNCIMMGAGCKNHHVLADQVSGTLDTTSKILYIGTYTDKESHVDDKATGIYVYKLDMATGTLSPVSTSPGTVNPSYIQVHPSGQWIYAVNETGSSQGDPSGTVSAFRLTKGGTVLEFINTVPSAGNYPCFIQIDQTGHFAMVANYGSGTVSLLPLKADGSLGTAVSTDRHAGRGPSDRQEAAHAHMIEVSPDNQFAYSCDLGTDKIYRYLLDTENGTLIASGDPYSTKPGSGPRHLVFHPVKNFVYVVNELNGTIECMTADTLTGKLSGFQIISTLAAGDGHDAGCADIHIAPSGNFLYASNRGTYNNIAMYSIAEDTGTLTLIGHQDVKGKTPRSFVIDPTGTYLLVANQDSDNVVTFRIDPETGKLIDTGIEASIPTPVCLKFLR
jgi:6-phosphogluconolactonase